jgi:hypothetical protein
VVGEGESVAHPSITVDDQEIRYKSLNLQVSVLVDIKRPLLLTDLSEATAQVIGVDGIDVEGRPFSFLCRQAWPNDGTCPTQFYTLGEDHVQMVKKVVAPAIAAPI